MSFVPMFSDKEAKDKEEMSWHDEVFEEQRSMIPTKKSNENRPSLPRLSSSSSIGSPSK